jgi:hypothetical protein
MKGSHSVIGAALTPVLAAMFDKTVPQLPPVAPKREL